MSTAPRPRRQLAIAVVLALLLGACDGAVTSPSPTASSTATPTSSSPAASPSAVGSPTDVASPTPLSSDELAAVYAEINEQVQAIRGIDEEAPVEPQILSPDEMGDLLEEQIREESPPELLEAYERLYQAMGLMPQDETLADVYVDLLESQVAGLYVPTDKSLYVVSEGGGVGPVERVFYAHEYQHALQDQAYDLQLLQPADLVDQTDRQLARQALIEGDAYVVMTYWLQQHLTPVEVLDVLNSSNDQEALEALERIPPIVSNQFLFPATNGLVWVLGLQTAGGWEAVEDAFANPPDSTEQILHPEKFAEREAPIPVALPDDLAAQLGDGWTLRLEDTFGEHQLGVWLTGTVPTGGLPPAPPAAAAGWGGDRVGLLEGPADAWAVVLASTWDTAADASEFQQAIGVVVGDGQNPGTVLIDGRDVTVVIASDGATLDAAVAASGFPRR